jgi:hypothetical protein
MKIIPHQVIVSYTREKALEVFLGLLILGLLFLSYHKGQQWRGYEHDLGRMVIKPKAFTAPPAQLPPVQGLESYSAIVAMPVFHQTRHAYVAKNLADAAAIALANLQHYTLIGIIFTSSGKNKAFFKNQQSGDYVTLTKDKKIEGCSVAGFSKIDVTLDCSHVEKKFAVREAGGEASVSSASASSGGTKPSGPRPVRRPQGQQINRMLRLPRQ